MSVRLSVWLFFFFFVSPPVTPAGEGSCCDCRTLRNARVRPLRGGKITLIMCGRTDRMVAIERGECVWTDGGLCYYCTGAGLRLGALQRSV